jgi:hypothetical protein
MEIQILAIPRDIHKQSNKNTTTYSEMNLLPNTSRKCLKSEPSFF